MTGLTHLTLLVLAAGGLSVPMPPPPPGMVAFQAEAPAAPEKAPVAAPANVPEPKKDADDEDEIEQMHEAEDLAIDATPPAPGASLRAQLEELGLDSPYRSRLEEALERAEAQGETLANPLAPVTNLLALDTAALQNEYDIPVEMQPLVAQYIHFFQTAGRKWFRRWMSRSTRYIPMMTPILEAQGLPRDLVYLSMIESGFNTSAKSWAAAVGPWQFIAGTAKIYELRNDFWVDDRRDPVRSTVAAAKFLKDLYDHLGNWYLAWAGYNTGGGRVQWMIDRYGEHDFWQLSDHRIGFARETKHYVPKLIACALVAKHPQAFGFAPEEFEFETPLEFDEVPLTDQLDTEVLMRISGMSAEEFQTLNPAVKRWATPPATAEQPFVVRVPKGKGEAVAAEVAKLPKQERLNYAFHKVGRGDTLSAIAGKYHSAGEAIMRMNGLRSARSLRVGSELIIPVPSAAALKKGTADAAFQRQVVQARKAGLQTRPEDEVPAEVPAKAGAVGGTIVVENVGGKKRVTYTVASGDSLWSIARRFDVHVTDLGNWNDVLSRGDKRMKIGTPLIIWPGPKATLPEPSAKR